MSELILILQGECDKHYGSEFVFEIHAKELIVGDIYVRIYNEQPTFPLEVSTSTCSDIEIGLSFIDYTFVNNDTLVLFPRIQRASLLTSWTLWAPRPSISIP